MGFEPTRAEHNGLAVHRLNHSATPSDNEFVIVKYLFANSNMILIVYTRFMYYLHFFQVLNSPYIQVDLEWSLCEMICEMDDILFKMVHLQVLPLSM